MRCSLEKKTLQNSVKRVKLTSQTFGMHHNKQCRQMNSIRHGAQGKKWNAK